MTIMGLQKRNVIYAVSEGCARREKNEDVDEITTDIRYQPMTRDDGFSDSQFHAPPPKIPWKSIGLASLLFLMGSLLIMIGIMLLSGFIDSKYSDRTWPVLILGFILFIPGFYHVRIAYYASKGENGFSFEDIPDFD